MLTRLGAELGGGQLDQESCALVARLALRTPALPSACVSALTDDVGLLARGAATSDILLASEHHARYVSCHCGVLHASLQLLPPFPGLLP